MYVRSASLSERPALTFHSRNIINEKDAQSSLNIDATPPQANPHISLLLGNQYILSEGGDKSD
jgi:hypothetical protein